MDIGIISNNAFLQELSNLTFKNVDFHYTWGVWLWGGFLVLA